MTLKNYNTIKSILKINHKAGLKNIYVLSPALKKPFVGQF